MRPMPEYTDSDIKKLDEQMSIERFWMEMGYLTPRVEDNLFMYAGLCSKRVKNCNISIDVGKDNTFNGMPVRKQKIKYTLELDTEHIREYNEFRNFWLKVAPAVLYDKPMENGKYLTHDSKMAILKKSMELNIEYNLARFIKDYLGNGYELEVDIVSKIEETRDGIGYE